MMEYCPCGDLLERLLAEGRAFEESRVAEVAATLLSTLQVPGCRPVTPHSEACCVGCVALSAPMHRFGCRFPALAKEA